MLKTGQDRVQGRVEVIWSMPARPFCRWQMLTTVGDQRKTVDHRGKASVLAVRGRGAACMAVERVSFACSRCARFLIQGIKGGSAALR